MHRFHPLHLVCFVRGQIFCFVVPLRCFFDVPTPPFRVSVGVSAIPPRPFCFSALCFTRWAGSLFWPVCMPRPLPFVTLFFSPHANSPPSPPVRCLFPCHSARILQFCAGSTFLLSSGKAWFFVSAITIVHQCFKPLKRLCKVPPRRNFQLSGPTIQHSFPYFHFFLFLPQGHTCFVQLFSP